jgi:excisionase family DNA binding protein
MSVDAHNRPAKPGGLPVERARSLSLTRIDESGQTLARHAVGSPGALEAALTAFLQSKTAGSPVPVERRIFLTLAESAEFSGLPVALLRRLIASGRLKAVKTGAGWRVSRAGIEGLSSMLVETPEDLTEHQLRDLEMNRRRRQQI